MKSARKRAASTGSAVDAVFDACSNPLRTKLKALRRLILDTAKATKGVGEIEEALKWGSRVTSRRKPAAAAPSGSTG